MLSGTLALLRVHAFRGRNGRESQKSGGEGDGLKKHIDDWFSENKDDM